MHKQTLESTKQLYYLQIFYFTCQTTKTFQEHWQNVIWHVFSIMVNTINQHQCSHPYSRELFSALPTDAFWHPTLLWGWGGQKSKKAQHTEETSCAVRKNFRGSKQPGRSKNQKGLRGVTTKSLTSQRWIYRHLWTDFVSPACRWKKKAADLVHSFVSSVIFPVVISCAFYALKYV